MCLAFAVYILTLNFQGMLMWDEAEYALSARTYINGETYLDKLRPPMMGVLGSIPLWLTGSESDFILTSSIAIMAILSCLSLGSLLFQIDSAFSGLMAAITLAFMPYFWLQSTMFLSEIPFILFFQCAILYFYQGLYNKTSSFHYAWIFVGLAFLTRYTALLLGPIFILMLVIKLLVSKKEFVQILKTRSFWFAPIWMLIIMAPWLIHQQMIHGDLLVGFKIAANQLSIYAPEVTMPWYFYLTNLTTMAGYPTETILLLSCVLVVYKKDLFGINCLVVLLFLLVWFSFYRYKELRLITSILPVVAVLVGIFLRIIKENYLKEIDHSLIIGGFLLLSIYFGYAHNNQIFMHNRTLGYPTLTEAMDWLQAQSDENDVVMGASTPQIEWYSNRQTKGFPDNMNLFKSALENCDWVVIVNYERGQAKYLSTEIKPEIYEELIQSGNAQIFRSQNGYFSLLVKCSELAICFE
jgi:4-amino-4-deoxy-L-arabinose transferase-like glycosyltransferase